MSELDERLLLAINQGLGWAPLDRPMLLLSSGWLWIATGAVVAVTLIARLRGRGLLVVLSMLAAIATSDPLVGMVLKPLADRLRPCVELSELVRQVAECRGGWSFPSNHAANAAALVAALGVGIPRSLWLCVPAAALVGLSRVYLGMHYPSDVLAGYVVGAACGLAWGLLARRLARRYLKDDCSRPVRTDATV